MEVKPASFASGSSANLAVGYMFSSNIGIELNGILGVATNQYASIVSINDKGDKIDEHLYTQARFPVLLTPSLVVQTGKKVHFYMRGGIALPLRTKLTNEGTADYQQAGTGAAYTLKRTATYYTAFHPGFTGDMGLNFQLARHVRFFVEAHLLSMSLFLKQVDYKGNVSLTHVYYKAKTNGGSDYGTYSLPFSSIGGNGGLIFEL